MKIFKQIWIWLTTSSPKSIARKQPSLYQLDVARLLRELKVQEDAKRLGLANLPASDAVTLSGTESLIVQRVETARHDFVHWASLRLSVLNEDLSRQNIIKEIDEARHADKEFDRLANSKLSEQGVFLQSMASSARSSREELQAFRNKHKLSRHANIASGSSRYIKLAL